MNSKFHFFLILIISLIYSSPTLTQTQKKSPDLKRLLFKGDSLLTIKKFESAKDIFKNALKIYRNSTYAISKLGKIAIDQEKWGEAKDQFGKILKQNPNNLEAHFYCGISYRETGKFKALLLRKLDWNKSKNHFLKVIHSDSLFKDVFYQFARLKRYRGKYDEAILLCHTQIRLRPELTEPRIKLFRFYRYFVTHYKKKKALEWLTHQPWDEAKFATGEMLRRTGKLDQAESIFKSLINKQGKMPIQPNCLSLARLYSKKRQPSDVEKYFWFAVNNIKNDIQAELVFDDVKYIITDQEFKIYQSLNSIKEKIDFFHLIWTSRNPLPASENNVRLSEHYKRIVYAEKYYEFDGFRTWFNNPDKLHYFNFTETSNLNHEFNDKGLIFLRHGKASEAIVTVGENIPSNESWLYYETGNSPKMTFHFVLENSAGYWRLTPIITNSEMLYDRVSWGNIYHRLLQGDPLERLSIQQEMADESRISVSNGLSTDRYSWDKKIKPLPIPSSFVTFRGKNGKTILEVYYALSLAPLLQETDSKQKQMNVEKGISIHDQSWRLIEKKNELDIMKLDRSSFLIDFYRFEVLPDSYNVSFFARPQKSYYLGGWKFKKFVDNYSTLKLSLSDIQMASLITSAQPGNKFNKRDLLVIPNPSKTYSNKKPVYIYFEVYNLQGDSKGNTKFVIEYTLSFLKGKKKSIKNLFGIFGSKGKSSISTLIDREGNNEFSVEFLAIDVSKVKIGEHELSIKIADKISGETVSKKGELTLK